MQLNNLSRDLQEQAADNSGSPNRRHDPRIYPRIAHLRSQSHSYASIAAKLADEFPSQKPLSKDAAAAIVRRSNKSPWF